MAKQRAPKEEPEYYTVAEAMAKLRIKSESTIYRLIKSGKLKSRLLGGKRLIPRSAVEYQEQ